MLFLTPHTATIYLPTASTTTITVGYNRSSSAGTVRGHLVRKSALQMAQETGLDTEGAAVWMQNVGAASLPVGTHLVIDSETYAVTTERALRNAEGITSHETYEVTKV